MRNALSPALLFVTVTTACAWTDSTGPGGEPSLGRVYAGDNFACAISADLNVRCWGSNRFGQLGNGTNSASNTPTLVIGDRLFASMGVHGAGQHACAVTTDSRGFCWGENHFGQLGTGTTDHTNEPVEVAGGLRFRSISAGWRFTCGLSIELNAYCWGRGEWGQLGDGRATQSFEPTLVAGGHRFVAIEAGSNNLVCGIAVGGALYCWGLDRAGNIGTPIETTCTRADGLRLQCARIPTRVAPNHEFRDIAVGSSFACGVTRDNLLLCWGRNTSGQLGAPPTDQCGWPDGSFAVPCNPVPTAVLTDVRVASAGAEHMCAISLEGRAFCWGRNRYGELGDGNVATQATQPRPVFGALLFDDISAGVSHSCGVTNTGAVYCWGVNDRGQIGDGTSALALTPSMVLGGFGPS